MMQPRKFPKIRFVNLRTVGYKPYWGNWKHIKHNLTPRLNRYWYGQIIQFGMCAYYIELDYRRGNIIDQMNSTIVASKLPKN